VFKSKNISKHVPERDSAECPERLTDKIINLVEQAKQGIACVAKSAMVYTNYLIGKLIVEEYQQGKTRAEYGANLLKISYGTR
jgi:hypothetical protein